MAGAPTIEVTIAVDAPEAATYDQAPVEVGIVRQARENVLAVPVNALVALLEGGYAVERVAADGTSGLVGVEPGIFEDGWVEVRGDGLDAGDAVVVPS
jgi:multidrug efflux pump subunit AcrA (membrane-fusion protein)